MEYDPQVFGVEFFSLRLGRAFYLTDIQKYIWCRSNIFEGLLPQLRGLWLFLGYVYSSVLKYHFVEEYMDKLFRAVSHFLENTAGILDLHILLHYLSKGLRFLLKIEFVPFFEKLERF